MNIAVNLRQAKVIALNLTKRQKDQGAEVLKNLDNSNPENRRLAKYDYAKMNLTAGVTLGTVEIELKIKQEKLNVYIDGYEYQVRKIQKISAYQ